MGIEYEGSIDLNRFGINDGRLYVKIFPNVDLYFKTGAGGTLYTRQLRALDTILKRKNGKGNWFYRF